MITNIYHANIRSSVIWPGPPTTSVTWRHQSAHQQLVVWLTNNNIKRQHQHSNWQQCNVWRSTTEYQHTTTLPTSHQLALAPPQGWRLAGHQHCWRLQRLPVRSVINTSRHAYLTSQLATAWRLPTPTTRSPSSSSPSSTVTVRLASSGHRWPSHQQGQGLAVNINVLASPSPPGRLAPTTITRNTACAGRLAIPITGNITTSQQ